MLPAWLKSPPSFHDPVGFIAIPSKLISFLLCCPCPLRSTHLYSRVCLIKYKILIRHIIFVKAIFLSQPQVLFATLWSTSLDSTSQLCPESEDHLTAPLESSVPGFISNFQVLLGPWTAMHNTFHDNYLIRVTRLIF